MELGVKQDPFALAVLPSEEELNKLLESKVEQVCGEFKKLECIRTMSKVAVNSFYDSIIERIMDWKFETLKELEEQLNSQENMLLNQKRKVEDAKGTLVNALHNLKQINEKKCSTDVEKNYISKLCLQKFNPLLRDLYQMKGSTPGIVEYVYNDSFTKVLFCEENRLKIGHFETINTNANEFELMPEGYLKLDSTVSFKVVFCDLTKDINRIIKYFRWKVEVNGTKVETIHNFLFRTFRFGFHIKEMKMYTVSFHLLNEHVSGSPFSFMPFSPLSVDILNDDINTPSNPPNSPANIADSLYKVIRQSTPEKLNLENCRHARLKNLPSPGAPLRRPFQKLNEDKTEMDLSGIGKDDVTFDMEFHPSLASTGTELITQHLNNLNVRDDDSTEFDRSANQSLKPGFKTILMDQLIIKKNDVHDESDSDLLLKHNIENKPSVVPKLSDSDWDVPHIHAGQLNSANLEKKIVDDSNLNGNIINCVRKRLVVKFECKFEGENIRLQEPMGIAQLKSKEIVVSNTLANQMLLFNSEGRFLCEFGSSSNLNKPSAIVVLPDGKFAVKNTREIIMFSPKLLYLLTIGTNYLIKPVGLATDGRGNLLTVEVAVPVEVSILFIDSSGLIIKKVPIRGFSEQQLFDSRPGFVACWASIIYVCDPGLNKIHVIDAESGVLLNSFGVFGTNDGEFDHPSAVTFDAEGFLIIADRKNNRIQVFTPNGNFVGILRIDRPLKGPTGLHLSLEGHLYVLNCAENSLVKYSIWAN